MPASIAVCTAAITSPASGPNMVKPRMRSVRASTSAFMKPRISPVVRVRSTQDRRKIHIHLTERGRGLRKPLLGYAAGVINGATGDFSAAELEALRSALRKLKRNLERT